MNIMTTITIQGHDRHGWDTETVGSMEDVHAYLSHPRRGTITAYVDGREHTVPAGIGRRCA